MPPQTAAAASAPESPALLRQLGLVSATALVVSNMIGTGIFTSSGFLAGDLADPKLMLWIWIVGAVCALAGALCYSELAINFPASGGEYVYLTQAYGPTWGFMTGWVSFFGGFSGPIAATSLAFSEYLGYFWPSLRHYGGAQAAACSLIAAFTILNVFGLKPVAAIQNVLTGTKIVVLAGFILLGLAAGAGDWAHFSQPAARTSSTPIEAQFAISLFWIYLAYSGWNAATYVAEEIEQPARTLPKALAIGTALVAVIYILLNVLFIYSTPVAKMQGVFAIGSLSAANLFGGTITGIFTALMAVSLVSTVNAMVTIGPRVYYAMARNGAFLEIASRVHPQWRTPVFAILVQGLVAMVMTFTSFPSLVLYVGFLLNFFAAITVASLFVFRRRPGWRKLPATSFLWPLVPSVFMLVSVWMTLFGLTLEKKVAAVAVATVALGAAVFHFRLKSSHAQTAGR